MQVIRIPRQHFLDERTHLGLRIVLQVSGHKSPISKAEKVRRIVGVLLEGSFLSRALGRAPRAEEIKDFARRLEFWTKASLDLYARKKRVR